MGIQGFAKRSAHAFVAAVLSVAAVAKVADPDEYKLKFLIVEVKGTAPSIMTVGSSYRGTGYANLQTGESIEGVFFEYDCSFALLSEPMYPEQKVRPARWIKERQVLGVIAGPSRRPTECKLKVLKMDGHVYLAGMGGSVVAYTQQQYSKLAPSLTEFPTYEILPLSVAILEAKWEVIPGGVEGTGRGNVHDHDSAVAFTFTTACEGSLALTTQDVADRAAWSDRFDEWLRVVGRGDDGKPRRECVLRAKLQKNSVYVKNYTTGEITTLTQEEFKTLRAKRKAEQQAQGSATPQ